MRCNFDLQATEPEPGRSPMPRRDEVEWVPLRNHPVFSSSPVHDSTAIRAPEISWPGTERLGFTSGTPISYAFIGYPFGGPDPTSVSAASPSKVLQPDVNLDFAVHKISINRDGSALLLSGSSGLSVMYPYGRTSNKDNATICRTVPVGSQIYLSGNNIIRILQVSWHPNSDTHLGILSL